MHSRAAYQPSAFVGRIVLPATVAGFALMAMFLIYRDLDFHRFSEAFLQSDKIWLVALVAAVLLEQAVRAWKWGQILGVVKIVPTSRLFGAILASFGIQLVVPMPVTPLVRAWLVARLEKLDVATVLSTIAVDRYVDAIVFALFIAIVALSGLAPYVEGRFQQLLAAIAIVQAIMFCGFAVGLYRARTYLRQDDTHASRMVDWIARKGGRRFDGLRHSMVEGMVWPKGLARQVGIIAASVLMKILSASQFLFAGLALGVMLAPFDYVYAMVCSGLALLAATFVRVPGLYFFGTWSAFSLLGLTLEQAFGMLILVRVASMASMLVPGFIFGWNAILAMRKNGRQGAGRLVPAG